MLRIVMTVLARFNFIPHHLKKSQTNLTEQKGYLRFFIVVMINTLQVGTIQRNFQPLIIEGHIGIVGHQT